MSRKTPDGNVKITQKHAEHMTPLLAAPSTGPANTLHLESQRYIYRNAHHAVATVESHAGEEGKDEGVSLPHHSIHRSQGLTWHQTKEGAISLCPSLGVGEGSRMTSVPNLKPGILLL